MSEKRFIINLDTFSWWLSHHKLPESNQRISTFIRDKVKDNPTLRPGPSSSTIGNIRNHEKSHGISDINLMCIATAFGIDLNKRFSLCQPPAANIGQLELEKTCDHHSSSVAEAPPISDHSPNSANAQAIATESPAIIAEPEQIIQAAYKYVRTHGEVAKNSLKKLLSGIFHDPEIKAEELVDLILRHPDQPLKPLDVIQTNIIEKIYADEKFNDHERKTIIRFCDYATCIALPQQELVQIQRQIDEQTPLIKVETHDRPLIILHFTRLLPMSDYQAHEEEDPRSIIEQMPRRKLIRKNCQEISIPAEVGAGRGAGPSYKDLFIGGLAIQLNIPGFDLNLSKAIEAATGQIQAKLLDWIKPAKAIRIAVFVDENRDHDIKELKKLFPEIFFIKLPEVFNTHSYYQINNHRSDIMAAIPSDRESH